MHSLKTSWKLLTNIRPILPSNLILARSHISLRTKSTLAPTQFSAKHFNSKFRMDSAQVTEIQPTVTALPSDTEKQEVKPKKITGKRKRSQRKLKKDLDDVLRYDIDNVRKSYWEKLDDKTKDTNEEERQNPFEHLQEIELVIRELAASGEGMGIIEDNGWVVLVPFVLPGEKIRARVYRSCWGYSFADLVEVLTPSPERISAPCKYFGTCSGCQFQHLTYEKQKEFKKNVVINAFKNFAPNVKSLTVNDVVGSPMEFGYRTKLTPHFQKPKSTLEKVEIGFAIQGRRQILDIEDCMIGTPSIQKGYGVMRDYVFENKDTYKRGATLLIRETNIPQENKDENGEVIYEKGYITDHKKIVTEMVEKHRFDFPAGSFFQNNASILPLLINYAAEHLQATEEDKSKIKYMVDAYCGSGLFAISCHAKFDKVLGVEISRDSVNYAKQNVELNNINNCEFIVGDAEEIFKEVKFDGNESAMVIDPPRKGCSDSFLDQLLKFAPARVVYVSCNVQTQARDLAYIHKKASESTAENPLPDYDVVDITPFDLFPQTKHIESVMTLVKRVL
ncbi:tRNA(m5U54)methyltransferase [Basidiobolus ranarum]|uniref:tRNA(M5U54)methyltransferase n=1 Tax=Basidiobolus ranarum TaxID=34480 RepID=A0ABR2VQN3_9FUNG